jgi:site-specific recombinase XerD
MSTDSVSWLRQRMIEDMNARRLCAGTQRGHIRSCTQFAAFLKRSPDTATSEDIRRFQLHLAESGASICNRNRIMTGLRFLFRVTPRRLDLAAEIYHLREPQKIPLVMSPDETKRLSRASVFNVRTSSFVHGRSLVIFFAIPLPHALLLIIISRYWQKIPRIWGALVHLHSSMSTA